MSLLKNKFLLKGALQNNTMYEDLKHHKCLRNCICMDADAPAHKIQTEPAAAFLAVSSSSIASWYCDAHWAGSILYS